MTQSARAQSNPGWFCTILSRPVCGRTQPSRKVGSWYRAGCVLPESWPDDFWTPACFQIGCIWPKPDKAIQIGSGPVLHNMIQAFFGKTELNLMREVGFCIYTIRPDTGCTLAVMAITGRNQNASGSDPACLLGCTLTLFFPFFLSFFPFHSLYDPPVPFGERGFTERERFWTVR